MTQPSTAENQPPRVVVFKRGQLSPDDKAVFRECGILAIEADDPSAVVELNMRAPLILESTLVSGDAVLVSLLCALASQSSETSGGSITAAGRACAEFVRLLSAAVTKPAGWQS